MGLIKQRESEIKIICQLDPLQIDEEIQLIPQYNKTKNIGALKKLLGNMLPNLEAASQYTYAEAAAAIRDIGILLGSLKRHGLEPVEVVPEIKEILFLLGDQLDMPPRDTVITYTIWNPTDSRERNFTHFPDERNLKKNVRQAMVPLEAAIYNLVELHKVSPNSPDYSQICHETIANFKPMIEGIVKAKREVSPKVFALELRHYYDEISLGGKSYLGPGAVEMPLFVFEHLLWSSDNTDSKYKIFKEGYLPYIFPNLREIYAQYENKASLITKMRLGMHSSQENPEQTLHSAHSLLKLCMQIRSFRLPHTALAGDAYEAGLAQRDRGSGGYSVESLVHIDQIMHQTVQELKASVEANVEKKQTEASKAQNVS